MQNTTNLNLKKPEYTDFADIQDINDNMDTLDEAIHDTQNSVATFTSSDVADGSATSWTTVPKVDSGETHKSIFAKMSQMFKNIRYLYKMLGTTDISSIGNGTVTGGLSSLNSSLPKANATNLSYRFNSGGIPYEIQLFYSYSYQQAHIILYDTRTSPYTRVWTI